MSLDTLPLFKDLPKFPASSPLIDARTEARIRTQPKVHDLQMMLMRDLYKGIAVSADAWAVSHKIKHMLVRPRLTYLKQAGLIYRSGFGLSVDDNKQDRYSIFPYMRERIKVIADVYGVDKAIEQILTEKDVEKFARRKAASK